MTPDYRRFDATHPHGSIDGHDTEGGTEDSRRVGVSGDEYDPAAERDDR